MLRTMNEAAKATIPGNLLPSREKYLDYYCANAWDRKFRRACTYLPWDARHLPFIGKLIIHWTATSEHLQHGCLNPAVVVDASKNLVAVFTDLAAGEDVHFPVVKVVRERLDLAPQERVLNGSRFAAAAVYFPTKESLRRRCWNDFSPIVVDCLVDDRNACAAALARVKPLAWHSLDIGMNGVPKPFKEGLFRVDVPTNILDEAW